MVPEIRTSLLLLRGWSDADRPPFAALNADPVVELLGGGLRDRDASDALIPVIEAHWAEHGCGPWAVERLAGKEWPGR